MTKKSKRIFISLAAVTVLILLAGGIFYLKFNSELKEMTPAETGFINDSVLCVKDQFVNCYLFKNRSGYVLIDAGVYAQTFKHALHNLGVRPDEIKTVLLTHTDGDHIGAMELFPSARVYMHKDEEQMINGTTGKIFFMKTKWKYGPYNLFNSGDTLKLDGLNVRAIHTPGHTPGSCCFLINNNYLAAGDNVSYKNGAFKDFNNFFNMNTDEQKASIAKLSELKTTPYILTAHYGIVRQK